MNPLEQQLDYVFADRLPESGHTMEVTPGVYWVRMPLPFALDHINLWVMRDEIDGVAGWTIIDCGISDETIRANWELNQKRDWPIVTRAGGEALWPRDHQA